jgi:hypothetical protein
MNQRKKEKPITMMRLAVGGILLAVSGVLFTGKVDCCLCFVLSFFLLEICWKFCHGFEYI